MCEIRFDKSVQKKGRKIGDMRIYKFGAKVYNKIRRQ